MTFRDAFTWCLGGTLGVGTALVFLSVVVIALAHAVKQVDEKNRKG